MLVCLLMCGLFLINTMILLQVLKLKEQLCDAEKTIQTLLERRGGGGGDGVSSNSPSTSSFPMEAPPFFGEFGMDGLDDVLYVDENHYGHVVDQWIKFYGMWLYLWIETLLYNFLDSLF